jgi:cell fate (sporulation/competence/biofilm development) regulator YlbF (YheA/YmcA/DUF963 family)
MVEKKMINREQDYRQMIQRQASKLAELLWQSPEYRQFVSAKNKLEADSKNTALLVELRQQQMSLRMASMLGEDVDDDFVDMEGMFMAISEEPAISDYLFAEGRFFRLIADVEEVFSDKLDLWQVMEEKAERPEYNINLN